MEPREFPDHDTAGLRKLALWFLLTAVVFFPLILNPVLSGFFEKSGADLLQHVEDHLSALQLIFTGIGLTELSLGAALWTWGRHVARLTPGRSGAIAKAFAWVALAAGAFALTSRLANSWFQSAADIADDDISAIDVIFFLPAAIGFSLSVIVFGVLMVKGGMPTWLGVVWVICGLMFWIGILPLWFFVAALVFGVWGLASVRPGRFDADRVAAIRIPAGQGPAST